MSGKNVLNNTLDVNNRVHRSPFDKSYQNNLTFNIGQIIPAFCQLMPPGSSFRANPTFALQFMPMVFPVQTRMRAQLSFYKVPLRTLWKDYMNFCGNFKKGLIPPYLDIKTQTAHNNLAITGSLGDYMNLPTTLVGSYGAGVQLTNVYRQVGSDKVLYFSQGNEITTNIEAEGFPGACIGQRIDIINKSSSQTGAIASSFGLRLSLPSALEFPSVSGKLLFSARFNSVISPYSVFAKSVTMCLYNGNTDEAICRYAVRATPASIEKFSTSNPVLDFEFTSNEIDTTVLAASLQFPANGPTNGKWLLPPVSYNNLDTDTLHLAWIPDVTAPIRQSVTDITLQNSPWYNSTKVNKDKQIMLSAYPFRAYEAIYNAYYRDNRNNPYVLNGELEYNVWIPSDEGGADSNEYKIRYKNWEQDFLTTAVQSPQQGIAPLVGLTTYTQTLADGTSQASVSIVDEDGVAYKVRFKGTETSIDDVSYVKSLDDVTYEKLSAEEKATVLQPRSLYDLASTGISISDLRYVNAYQKYLEMNMRKGYSYRDVIKGHFDTNVRFDALMLPEYLGGTTQDVNMNSIVQTVETDTSGSYAGSLGSMAGNATVRGSSRPISCYCDEECYIIGLLSVSPVPNYSQLLPKHFLHRDLLDSFYPEFDNIGFQPITYKEVCPIQAFNDRPDMLSTTFGYQRAWYDYITQTDEVHGLFRTNLRNFLINRVFDVKPELSESFLLIDPDQVNDVFSVTESSHKIFGQIWFDYTAKLPISRTSIPKLD